MSPLLLALALAAQTDPVIPDDAIIHIPTGTETSTGPWDAYSKEFLWRVGNNWRDGWYRMRDARDDALDDKEAAEQTLAAVEQTETSTIVDGVSAETVLIVSGVATLLNIAATVIAMLLVD